MYNMFINSRFVLDNLCVQISNYSTNLCRHFLHVNKLSDISTRNRLFKHSFSLPKNHFRLLLFLNLPHYPHSLLLLKLLINKER